jgi:O-acetyl-ADP-ribose deacetylase (regulator of RNase III)
MSLPLTQEGEHEHGAKPGRASLSHVHHCLKRLRHELEVTGIDRLALPRLATGVGGLDWNDVLPLIVQHLGDLSIPIYFDTLHAGQKAVEKG